MLLRHEARIAPAATQFFVRYLTAGPLLLLLSFLWGSSYPLIRIAVGTIPPASTVALRVVIGSGLLSLLLSRQNLRLPRSLSVWGRLFIQACLNITIPFTLISWGEQFIGGGLAGILNATPPVFVALLAWMGTRHEPLTVRKAAGVILGITGVVAIVGPSAVFGLGRNGAAELAILAASLCYALAAVGAHRLATLPPLVSATGTVICAAATMVPVSLILEHPWNLAPSTDSLGAAVCLGVFSTSAAYVVYFRLLSLVGPLGTASGSYLRAGVAVLLGTLFLHETFTPATAIGLGCVLFGVAILTTRVRRRICGMPVSSR